MWVRAGSWWWWFALVAIGCGRSELRPDDSGVEPAQPESGTTTPQQAVALTAATGFPGRTSFAPDEVERLVGRPCVPPRESYPGSPGANYAAIFFDDAPDSCGDFLCLVYRFQGRVSCPYGQTAEAVTTLPAEHPNRCRTPDGEAVTAVVLPQLVDRRADLAVTCSCSCAGGNSFLSDPSCECPSGTSCQEIRVPALQNGAPDRVVDYCVPTAALDPPESPSGDTCDSFLEDCGNAGNNP